MNIDQCRQVFQAQTGTNKVKQVYSTPKLLAFGRVAALTQGQSGCAKDDNAICGQNGDMGPKPKP